jgi:hypothetical protein
MATITTSPAKTTIPAELQQRCYVLLFSDNNIINHGRDGVKFWDALPDKTYFAVGVNGSQKGQAYFMCWDNGTCLKPIYNEQGKFIVMPEFAGKVMHREQTKIKFTHA